ncbi:MAG: hypothetical protein WAS27_01330, partial [Candidatus Saccharimonadales bacterium]
ACLPSDHSRANRFVAGLLLRSEVRCVSPTYGKTSARPTRPSGMSDGVLSRAVAHVDRRKLLFAHEITQCILDLIRRQVKTDTGHNETMCTHVIPCNQALRITLCDCIENLQLCGHFLLQIVITTRELPAPDYRQTYSFSKKKLATFSGEELSVGLKREYSSPTMHK